MEISLETYINNANEASDKGVPVNWREIAATVASAANHQIQDLTRQLEEAKKPPVPEKEAT
jgi:hypothetical protein